MNYEIKGGNLPVVICHLKKGEYMLSDSGAMSWMDPVMKTDYQKLLAECLAVKLFFKINIRLLKME